MRDPEEAVKDPAAEVVETDTEAGAVDLSQDPVQGSPSPDIGTLVIIIIVIINNNNNIIIIKMR